MKKLSNFSKVLVAIIALGVLFLSIHLLNITNNDDNSVDPEAPRIIVGWQTAWATCGQIIETLDHTNITKLYNSSAIFRNFLFGPDMLEAGLGGSIDATTIGVVPTINLLAASSDWVIICRLIDFSVVTLARTGTNISTFSDIKGKTLGVPFGSGAHPYIVERIQENKLRVGKGSNFVNLINISPAESIVILQQGGVDALGTWEPNATIIENKGLGKSIDEKRYIGFICVRKSLVENYPDQVVALIKSIIEANLYVAKNRDQTDEWFAKRSNFDIDLLKKIRIIEPNLNARKIADVSVSISNEDIDLSQKVADSMYESGLIKKTINIKEHINSDLAKRAYEEILRDGSIEPNIKIILK